MAKPQQGEQYPLLLFFVGDSRQFTRENRRFFGSGGRFSGITSGASNVITEWPNFVSNCWITILICGLSLFILSTLFLMTIGSSTHHRMPRCTGGLHPPDNMTIHLVHGPYKWTQKQLEMLDKVSSSFPDYKIHLISIHGKRYSTTRSFSTTTQQISNNEIPKENLSNATSTPSSAPLKHANAHVNQSSLLLTVLLSNLTADAMIDEFIGKKFANVIVIPSRFDEIFRATPLFFNWPLWNNQMKLFAARVMQMWQYGGLSFDITSCPKNSNRPRALISSGLQRFQKLNASTVSIDEEGYHMEAKMPCHAFFGQILADLRKIDSFKAKPKQVLRSTLNLFCKENVVDASFC